MFLRESYRHGQPVLAIGIAQVRGLGLGLEVARLAGFEHVLKS